MAVIAGAVMTAVPAGGQPAYSTDDLIAGAVNDGGARRRSPHWMT
jgi:hypothetical protein